jgi:hypothetical protein
MPLRFPVVYATIHRALLRRYPFAVFFRIRPATEHVVVLAVFPQARRSGKVAEAMTPSPKPIE